MKARYPGFRAAALAACALGNALLLQGSPGLRAIHNVSLPPPISITLPAFVVFLIGSAAVLSPSFVFKKLVLLPAAYTTGCIAWSFAASSRVPWWLLGGKNHVIAVVAPGLGAVTLSALTTLSVLAFILVQNLEAYAASFEKRGLDPDDVRPDLRRITTSYTALALVTCLAGVVLSLFFENFIGAGDFVPTLSGTAWGAWVLILVAALLGGILLVLGRGAPRPKDEAAADTKPTTPEPAPKSAA